MTVADDRDQIILADDNSRCKVTYILTKQPIVKLYRLSS